MIHYEFMREALNQAKIAGALGEVPIGAVIVRDNKVIACGHNMTETLRDPTQHAEMIAIRNAAQVLGGWRLTGCTMYVTCEPCAMCAGAIIWSRIEQLFIGTDDPKAGCCGSVLNIVEKPDFNHNPRVIRGIMQKECSDILRQFFSCLRNKKKRYQSQKANRRKVNNEKK